MSLTREEALARCTRQDLSALQRFNATCEDGEGYDVPKLKMERLALLGVIKKIRGTTYEITDLGRLILDNMDA